MSQDGKFVETADAAIVELLPDCSGSSRIGYVNIGVFSVQLVLNHLGNLIIKVDPRQNEGTVELGKLTITKESSVDAGGVDPDE